MGLTYAPLPRAATPGRPRSVALVVIPLSLVTASLVLWAFGSTMNVIVLTGLAAALMLVIDDAVVTVDNFTRRLRKHAGEGADEPAAATVRAAVLQMLQQPSGHDGVRGRIFNISSQYGTIAVPQDIAYGTSNAAVIQITRQVARLSAWSWWSTATGWEV